MVLQRIDCGRKLALTSICAAVFLLLAVHVRAVSPVAIAGETMGTTWSVKFMSPEVNELERAKLAAAIQSRLDDLEARMSTYRSDSEVIRFNRTLTTNWYQRFIGYGVRRERGAAREPSLGWCVRHHGRTARGFMGFRKGASCSDTCKTSTRLRTFARRLAKLEANLSPPALRKSAPDVAIDLSGIAKGLRCGRRFQTALTTRVDKSSRANRR